MPFTVFVFFSMLHDFNTPRFSSLQFVDTMLRRLTPLLFCSTESEASFLGCTIRELLAYARKYRDDKAVYEASCVNCDGFLSSFPGLGACAENEAQDLEEIPDGMLKLTPPETALRPTPQN